jgi:hypothetical protein
MNQPKRIQRKRVKGWEMPPNAMSVTRPGEFGNPFAVGGWYKLGNGSGFGFIWMRLLDESKNDGTYCKIENNEQAVQYYKKYRSLYPLKQNQLERLKGKDLACWCKEGQPCHADILLELANKK